VGENKNNKVARSTCFTESKSICRLSGRANALDRKGPRFYLQHHKKTKAKSKAEQNKDLLWPKWHNEPIKKLQSVK
jgi:hypothetical protein